MSGPKEQSTHEYAAQFGGAPAVETLAALLREQFPSEAEPHCRFVAAKLLAHGVSVGRSEGGPEMQAFDRAEFDELLREVVALREWKAAHEAAAFRSEGGAPSEAAIDAAYEKLEETHGDDATRDMLRDLLRAAYAIDGRAETRAPSPYEIEAVARTMYDERPHASDRVVCWADGPDDATVKQYRDAALKYLLAARAAVEHNAWRGVSER